MNTPMSDVMFWYNHLTYEQRMFIEDYQVRTKLVSKGDLAISHAYSMKEQFHTMPDWPETPMRQI